MIEKYFEGERFTIYLWHDEGVAQVHEFLSELRRAGNSDAPSLVREIENTAKFGPNRRKDRCRPLGDGIFEIKARKCNRVLFFYRQGENTIICTHACLTRHNSSFAQEKKRAQVIRQRCIEEGFVVKDKETGKQ